MHPYELDNDFRVADSISIAGFPRRHHTFHQNLGSAFNQDTCDEDWIEFVVTSTRNVIMVTRPAPVSGNEIDADTFFELYQEVVTATTPTINLIATDNNDSPYGVGFSRIERKLDPGTYYLRIRSAVQGRGGHYILGIFPERENWGNYGGGGSGGTGGNADGDIDFGVDNPFTGGDIDGDGNLDYLCNGAQLNLQGLDNDPLWSVQWSTSNPSVSAISGFIQVSNGFSGNIVITATIFYNGTLIGNTMKTIWVDAPAIPTLVIDGLREGYIKCQGEPIYFNATFLQGFPTSYTWTIYRNLVEEIYTGRTDHPFLSDPFLRNLPVGDYFATVSACNDCGCNESDFVEFRVISKDEQCTSFIPDRGKIRTETNLRTQLVIYPNPVSHQLTIKLPSSYSENATQIELYNSIGQLVLSKYYIKTTIELPVSSFSKGLYVLKIQNGNEMKTEKIIIE